MRGSAAFRTGVAPGGALAGPWVRNPLWTRARAVPSLDLRFADNKSLVDATTGQNLVTFTRASSGTFVGSDGLVKTAVTNLLQQSEDFSTTWANTESTEASNVETAPNGTLTADKLIPDVGVTSGQFRQDVSKAATATTYTCSVYGKAAEFNRLSIRVEHNGSTGNRADVGFSLSDGSVVSAAAALGTFSGASATATSVGAGWYRFTLSFTSSTETSIRVRLFGFDSSLPCNGTSGIYLWGAQLEQSTTVGEYIPTTSVINSAPRFDHNPTTGESLGLLVEEARTNLLLRSEEFDNASWPKILATASANAISAPNGTTTADKLEETSGTGEHIFYQGRTGSNETVTLSIFCKQAERTRVRLGFSNFATEGTGAIYDLASGSVVSVAGSGIDYTNPSASISAFGNGWFRCVFTITKGIINTTNNPFVETVTGTSFSFAGTAGSGIYLWGAQLEAGAFATSYIPTTTATATRAADVASIGSSAFTSFYNQSEGTVFADFLPRANATAGVVYLSAGNVNEATRIFYNLAVSNYTFSVRAASAEQSSINNLGAYVLQSERISAAYKVNDLAASRNGGASISDTSATLPTGIDRLELGTTQSANYLNGTLRRLVYWGQRLPNSTLQAITG